MASEPGSSGSNRGDTARVGPEIVRSSQVKQCTRRIAIVEDEKSLCSLFSMLLRRRGYAVELEANRGTEVVEAAVNGSIHPDLILMDYRMPVMNGLDAAKAIRKARPEIKIVMITADDSIRNKVASEGFLFISKPFSVTALGKELEETLKES